MKTKITLSAVSRIPKVIAFCGMVLVLLTLNSCAARERVSPLSNIFLEDVDIKNTTPNLPFDHAWIIAGLKPDHYKSILIKPIRTDLLPRDAWARSSSVAIESKEDYLAKVREIAKYFHAQLIDRMKKAPDSSLPVVEAPQPDTLVLEIAFTELELSRPIARAGALVAPVPGSGAALGAITDPHVAFAARFTDASTEQLIATAADRKFAPTRLVDLNKLTVSSSAREICSLWADTLSESILSGGLTEVDEKRFDILPW